MKQKAKKSSTQRGQKNGQTKGTMGGNRKTPGTKGSSRTKASRKTSSSRQRSASKQLRTTSRGTSSRRISGTKATDLLKKDHDKVKKLFSQFEKAGDDSSRRRDLFDDIKRELDVHTKIEEEIFY